MTTIFLIFYALLLGAVWVFYPEFTAVAKDSIWSSIAYWSTMSAGKTGTLIIVATTSILYAIKGSSAKERIRIAIQSFLVIGGLLTGFALLNEHVIKTAVKRSRPSHTFIIRQTGSTASLDSLYSLAEARRKVFFHDLIASDTVHFKAIDQRILDHWVDESGYSFPSGHSFNAFLLAGILASGIYQAGKKSSYAFCTILLLWAGLVAVSRVAVGAHSALDVTVGAGMGLLFSQVLLRLPITRKILSPKRTEN